MSYDPTNTDRFSELLSAYLDGELTADEQAQVEGRLAENAECRQLHDELRALRSGLESLPRYRLKEDLAASVLRRAERAMLSAPAVVPAASAVPEAKQVSLAESVPVSEQALRGLRAFRWSIVALAVALLIMVFNPGKDKAGREVALETPPESRKRELRDTDALMPAAPPTDLAMQAKEAPAEGAATSGDLRSAGNRAFDANASERDRGDLARKYAEDPGAGKDRTVGEELLPKTRDAASLRGESLAMPARAAAKKSLEKSDSAKGALSRFAESAGEKWESDGQSSNDQASQDGLAAGAASALAEKLQLDGATAGRLGSSPDRLLIVQCDISPEAARAGAFAQLLAEQQIALVEGESTLTANLRGRANDAAAGAAAANDAQESDLQPGDGRAGDKQFAPAPDRIDADRVDSVESEAPQLEAVLVEASPEQIAATFAGLQSRTEEFYSLNIQPSQPSALGTPAERRQATDALLADEMPVEQSAVSKPTGGVASESPSPVKNSANEEIPQAEAKDGTPVENSAVPQRKSGSVETGKLKAASRGLDESESQSVNGELGVEGVGGGAGLSGIAGGLGAAPGSFVKANAQRVPISEAEFRQLAPQAVPLGKGTAREGVPVQSQQRRVRNLATPNVPAAAVETGPAELQTVTPQAAPLAAESPPPAPAASQPQAGEAKAGVSARPSPAPPVRVLFLLRVVPAHDSSR